MGWIIAEAWPYILGALALVGGWFAARHSGKESAKREQVEQSLEATRKANENRSKVERIDDLPSEFDRLHKERRR